MFDSMAAAMVVSSRLVTTAIAAPNHIARSSVTWARIEAVPPPLRVASAFPDPPFDVSTAPPSGLDVDLMRAVAARLGREYEAHRYTGDDFEGIYDGLAAGDYDVVTSGATITMHRATKARFCTPYLRSGQSLVVNHDTTPAIRSTADLRDAVLGVQRGNTSEPVAGKLLAHQKVREVRRYGYGSILQALDDLEAGRIQAVMKLEPVMRELTRDRPALQVVQTGITEERIASAVRLDDTALAADIDAALRALADDGTLADLGRRWLADSDPTATMMVV
jgi:ABC-type amino acid transport substrate-binding protein